MDVRARWQSARGIPMTLIVACLPTCYHVSARDVSFLTLTSFQEVSQLKDAQARVICLFRLLACIESYSLENFGKLLECC